MFCLTREIFFVGFSHLDESSVLISLDHLALLDVLW
jgi:hypothetical protein